MFQKKVLFDFNFPALSGFQFFPGFSCCFEIRLFRIQYKSADCRLCFLFTARQNCVWLDFNFFDMFFFCKKMHTSLLCLHPFFPKLIFVLLSLCFYAFIRCYKMEFIFLEKLYFKDNFRNTHILLFICLVQITMCINVIFVFLFAFIWFCINTKPNESVSS